MASGFESHAVGSEFSRAYYQAIADMSYPGHYIGFYHGQLCYLDFRLDGASMTPVSALVNDWYWQHVAAISFVSWVSLFVLTLLYAHWFRAQVVEFVRIWSGKP